MAKHIRFLSLLALALAGTASARIIVGGEVVEPGDPLAKFTVRIFSDLGDPNGKKLKACTGTLIAKDLVLTAAHCTADENHRFVKNTATLRIHFNRFETDTLNPDSSTSIAAKQIIVAGGYFDANGVAVDPTQNVIFPKDNDIALLVLSEDAPEGFYPIPLARAWEVTDYAETLTVAGYGLEGSSENSRDGRLKSARVPLSMLGNNWYYSRVVTDYGTGNVCSGDSGGPLLIQTPNEGYKLAGVNNIAYSRCLDGNQSVRIEDYSEFLTRAMRSLGDHSKPNFTAPAKGKLERLKKQLKEQFEEYLD